MSPNRAYELAVINGPSEELEDLICQFPHLSWMYARDVLRGPFPRGEIIIARDHYSSYEYALQVLKAPFPAGEYAISRKSRRSYLYARDVLKAPFPAGEEVISKDRTAAYRYSRDVLKGRFEEAENLIVKHKFSDDISLDYAFMFNVGFDYPFDSMINYPSLILSYAICILKDRFPYGEPVMKKSPRIWKRYQEFINETRSF